MTQLLLHRDMTDFESKGKGCPLCNLLFVALKSLCAARIQKAQDYEVWAFCNPRSLAFMPLPSYEEELEKQVPKISFDEIVIGLRPCGSEAPSNLIEKGEFDKSTARINVHEVSSKSSCSMFKVTS